jgi:hypothetical protein
LRKMPALLPIWNMAARLCRNTADKHRTRAKACAVASVFLTSELSAGA